MFLGEEKEKRSQPIPSRPAPPPPEDASTSDDTNANKKKNGLFKKSKDKGKKSQTAALPQTDTLQAQPASKATPPSKDLLKMMKAAKPVKAPMEYSRPPATEGYSDDDEPREVENKMYMFDTESESEDEEAPDVTMVARQRKAPTVLNMKTIGM